MAVLAKSGVATTTIANAAFLQEVKESNFQLWALLSTLRGVDVTDDSRSNVARFVTNLGELIF